MNRTRKVTAIILTVLMVMSLMVGFGVKSARADDEVYHFKMGFSFPEVHPVTQRWTEWADALRERSDGRIDVEIFAGGTLLVDPESYESVTTGVADIGLIMPSYMPGLFPLTELYELPVGYNSPVAIAKVAWSLYEEFQPAEWNDVKVFSMYSIGPGAIASKKPITCLEDLQGMQIRSTGITANCLTALGAAPVAVTMPESYEALSRGTCDGIESGWDTFITWHTDEVADYYVATSFMYSSTFIGIMNLDKWNSLPEDLQAIFTEVSDEFMDYHATSEEASAKNNIQKLIDEGKNLLVLPEEEQARWRELIQPVIDAEIEKRESDTVPARAFYERMLELVEEYNVEEGFDDYLQSLISK